MSQSVITRHDIEHFTFREYRKHGTTKLSNETLEVGQRVQTLEGEYACGELSRLAIDAKGNVYPVAESVFAVSYEPAGADPAAEIARLRADVERLREAIAPVVAEINNRWADVHDESWSADYHCEFEMTVAECRTLLLAQAALADTADTADTKE